MTLKELAQSISKAAIQSFTKSQKKYGRDNIVGYALMSHDDANSCGPVIATKKGYSEYSRVMPDDFLFSPDDFRYSPEEWDCFDSGPLFDKVNDSIEILYSAGDYEIDPDWHFKFRKLVFNACVSALEILIKDGYFGSPEDRDNLIIIFSVSDSKEFEISEPTWIKRLNTKNVFNGYRTWHKAMFSKA